jgi:tetratricopeptide (TPR) repeat protein
MLPLWALWFFFSQAGPNLANVESALSRGEYRAALEQLSNLQARNSRWHLLASKAYDGLNDPAKAVSEAEEALALDPKQPANHVQLAQIFLSRNTPAAALDILTEAESLFPDVFMIRLGKGLALKELQLYQRAEHELQWCLARQPAAVLPFDALATIYVQQSRFEDAQKLAIEFIKQNASDYRGYYFLAAANDGQLLPEGQTIQLLTQSLDRNPSFAAAHALMGKVLLKTNKTRQAVKHLTRATELRPDLVQAHLNLARAYRTLGETAAATREFEMVRQLKAKEQEPLPSLRYHRGAR